MAAIDWTKMYQKYRGLWVALKSDEKTVAGYGKSIRAAVQRAKKTGTKDPILHKVPVNPGFFVGTSIAPR